MQGVTEREMRLVDDRGSNGTEFLMRRMRDGFLTLSDPTGTHYVFVSKVKAGLGGGDRVRYGVPSGNKHVWKENLIGQAPRHFSLIPHCDHGRALVAGKLGLIAPRRGVAVKHYSRFQHGWDSWTFERSDNQVCPTQIIIFSPRRIVSTNEYCTGSTFAGSFFRAALMFHVCADLGGSASGRSRGDRTGAG
jgi:hypothetical protein